LFCFSISSRTFAGRQKPIAPTCNITLVRNDRSTLSCEVTSSIRTRSPADDEEAIEDTNSDDEDFVPCTGGAKKPLGSEHDGNSEKVQLREILLCLRPIREGGPSLQVGKETTFHRFSKKMKKTVKVDSVKVASESSLTSRDGQRIVSEESNTERSGGEEAKTAATADSDDFLSTAFRPLKKRSSSKCEDGSLDDQKFPTTTMNSKIKRKKLSKDTLEGSALDASVVAESLMLMTKQQKKN
jgi:hypothetical protein